LEESLPKSTGRESKFRFKTLEIKGKIDFFRAGKLNGEMYMVAAVKKHVGDFIICLKSDSLERFRVVGYYILCLGSGDDNGA
jgi:hypothetical protein